MILKQAVLHHQNWKITHIWLGIFEYRGRYWMIFLIKSLLMVSRYILEINIVLLNKLYSLLITMDAHRLWIGAVTWSLSSLVCRVLSTPLQMKIQCIDRNASNGHRWIPFTKASNAELWCFVTCTPGRVIAQHVELLMVERHEHLIFLDGRDVVDLFNKLRPGDVFIRGWDGAPLVQVMVFAWSMLSSFLSQLFLIGSCVTG